MKTVTVFDGDQEIMTSEEEILSGLSAKQVVKYFKMTYVYHLAIRDALKQESFVFDITLLYRLSSAVDLLHQRMMLDLGEDTAYLIVAQTSLDAMLAQ